LTLPVSDLAAKLRAEYNLKTPDAIHAASALSSGASCIICNDQIFSRVKDIDCVVLDE
jgi:predicted nucleic acid-binding protein